MKVRIYLAGTIGCYGVGAEYPKLWHKMTSEWFEIYSGYACDYDFYCVGPIHYYEYGRDYHKSEKKVMTFDLRKVKSTDVILVSLKDVEKPPGTIDEVFDAWKNNTPVIGFLDTENSIESIELRTWIRNQIDRIETGEDAMRKAVIYIKNYYGESR